jgi:ubiquinone/menaquinone biosynthesis C-methylase UbiE
MPCDDPALVREQYARENNLQARRDLYEEVAGPHAPDVLWQTLVEWQPTRVLEVGGGPGELAERMQHELGASVRFVDISPRMVELARGRGIEARVGDVQALPFAHGEFDTVVAAWMLYHVPNIDLGLAEIARVLRPGGALIIESVVTVRAREKLVAYRESISVETQPVPVDVELPFLVHGRTTIFVATT